MTKTYLVPSLTISFLFFVVPGLTGQDCKDTDKKILTGSSQGYYFKLGKAIAQVAREEGLDLCVKKTDRNLDNVSDLEAGKAEFGIAQSDVAHDAWFGHPQKFHEPVKDVKIVMPLYTEAVHILLRPHLIIASLSDLRGRKVGLGLAGSGTEYTAEHIFAAVGLQAEGEGTGFVAVRTSDPVFCHSVDQLMNGTMDALFKVTVVPSVDIQDALRSDPNAADSPARDGCGQALEIKLLGLDHELVERLVHDGSYGETLIHADTYRQPDSTLTVGVQALLLAGPRASGKDVDTLAYIIRFKHREIDQALEAIVNEGQGRHGPRPGSLLRLSLLNVPMAALSGFVHPSAKPYIYDWWRDSWLPTLPWALLIAVVVLALLYWKRAALGHAMERQPNLIFAVSGTLVIWLVTACMFYHYEWAVNEHFNSFLRSLASTFLYLTQLSEYSLLTQDAQSFAQRAEWVNVVLLGGFASPLLKQGLDTLLQRTASWLQTRASEERSSRTAAVPSQTEIGSVVGHEAPELTAAVPGAD